MKTIVWVTGGTTYTNFRKVKSELSKFPSGTVVIHGDARGADTLADKAALELAFLRIRVPYHGPAGKAGGPIRNKLMAEVVSGLIGVGYNAHVLAFGGDRGTDGSVELAKHYGFQLKEFDR